MLIDVPPPGQVGQQVLELRDWAEQQLLDGEAGDRDHAPSHQYQAWQQVAIAARECLGAQKCPYGEECFAEKAKEQARKADIVITNHALLSIDAFENRTVLPEHDVVIVDEAHELPARVTGAAGDELSPQMVERAAKRSRRFVDDDKADDLIDASDALRAALDGTREGRIEASNGLVLEAAALVRDAARALYSDLNKKSDDKDDDPDGAKRQSKGAVKEIFDVAERVAALSDLDVVWMVDRDRFGRELRIAPLTVAGLLRELVLKDRTVVLTSATLTPRRRLRRDRPAGRSAPVGQARRRRRDAGARLRVGDRPAAVAWPRRRFAVRVREAGDPVRRQAPAAAAPRRARPEAVRRDHRPDHRRGWPDARVCSRPAGRPRRRRPRSARRPT